MDTMYARLYALKAAYERSHQQQNAIAQEYGEAYNHLQKLFRRYQEQNTTTTHLCREVVLCAATVSRLGQAPHPPSDPRVKREPDLPTSQPSVLPPPSEPNEPSEPCVKSEPYVKSEPTSQSSRSHSSVTRTTKTTNNVEIKSERIKRERGIADEGERQRRRTFAPVSEQRRYPARELRGYCQRYNMKQDGCPRSEHACWYRHACNQCGSTSHRAFLCRQQR